MANAIFTASESSSYDDQIERRYHFPKTYLGQAKQAIGDLILYYEPRRDAGLSSSGGRQAYFAVARLLRIDPDGDRDGHFYAHLDQFLEFDRPVPFKENGAYYESLLQKEDGSSNKGAFGRSVRLIPSHEFERILKAGFTTALEPWELKDQAEEEVPESTSRPIIQQVISRKFRDQAFRKHVRGAYSNTCAVTGLRLINGGGRPEVQAAHIRPVEVDGPDTVRNGIALTGTVHWLFDRGLISFDDNYNVLLSPSGLPDELEKLIPTDRKLILPLHIEHRPHPTYLRWHRENRFKQ
ncbi:restriction endonuclease [Stenotrophomonas terrae]|uniref:Restriction endonuclease n=1 Tax=Stenotrophomonas terrae TaxID=405446 RepID=A0A0R0C5Q0_9GAMM|nr:HNH endonuclease [Stenotrophomonas terrae]KRG65039.1 restriction endonuclease [Stenotrophomonas terrae]